MKASNGFSFCASGRWNPIHNCWSAEAKVQTMMVATTKAALATFANVDIVPAHYLPLFHFLLPALATCNKSKTKHWRAALIRLPCSSEPDAMENGLWVTATVSDSFMPLHYIQIYRNSATCKNDAQWTVETCSKNFPSLNCEVKTVQFLDSLGAFCLTSKFDLI